MHGGSVDFFSGPSMPHASTGHVAGVKGPPKKNKSGTPVVGGWVRGQKRTRVRFIFFDIFLLCF